MCPRPRPTAAACRFATGSEIAGGGTASMSVREKGRRKPGSQPARPFSRPQPPHNAAKVRGFSRTVSAFTAETDCDHCNERSDRFRHPRSSAPCVLMLSQKGGRIRGSALDAGKPRSRVADSPLEESGFEPLVPLATDMLIELARRISNQLGSGGRRQGAGAAVALKSPEEVATEVIELKATRARHFRHQNRKRLFLSKSRYMSGRQCPK
jgi:hypothetical protein